MTASTLLTYSNLIIAGIGIVSAAYSFYRGTLGELVSYIRMIPNMKQKQEDMKDQQEDMSDAIVALSHSATSDGVEVDPQALEEDLRDDDEGPGRYTRGGRLYRGERHTEDEHMECPGAKNRERVLGEEVEEP